MHDPPGFVLVGQLVVAEAQRRLVLRRPPDAVGRDIQLPDPLAGTLQRERRALLDLLPGVLGLPFLGDLAPAAAIAEKAAVRPEPRHAADRQHPSTPVAIVEREDEV